MSHSHVRHHCTRFFHGFQSSAAHSVEAWLFRRANVASGALFTVLYKNGKPTGSPVKKLGEPFDSDLYKKAHKERFLLLCVL